MVREFLNFLRRIFQSKVLPSWVILLFDTVITLVSVVLSFLLRFSASEMLTMGNDVLMGMALTLVFNLLFFRAFRTYSNVIRFSSFTDILHISVALVCSFMCSAVLSIILFYATGSLIADIGMLAIAYAVMFVFMALMRMTIKSLNDAFNEDRVETRNTFIYGTKNAGINIAKAIRMARPNKFHLKGFIADDPVMKGKVMMGVNVYLNDENLLEHIRENNVEAIIVSPVKADNLKNTDIADRLLQENVTIFLAPDVTDRACRRPARFARSRLRTSWAGTPSRSTSRRLARTWKESACSSRAQPVPSARKSCARWPSSTPISSSW